MKCLYIHRVEDAKLAVDVRTILAADRGGIDFDLVAANEFSLREHAGRLTNGDYDAMLMPLSLPALGALRVAELVHLAGSKTRLVL